jgi:hypothetical protein
MDRPKLFLVPRTPVPVTDRNVLSFGRLWPRHVGWREESAPRPAPAKLHSVPPFTPQAPEK